MGKIATLRTHMSIPSKFFYALAVVFLFNIGCERPPEFPATPSIEFGTVKFIKNSDGFDELLISISFQDGNGDLGLRGFEPDPKYAELIYPRKNNGDLIFIGDPEAPAAFNVCDFRVNPTIDDVLIEDTVYVQLNPNHNNIEIDFLLKRGSSYEEFDFRREFGPLSCQSFDGRFPILNSEEFERPLEGTLEYSMVSSGFLPLFGNDTVQLQVLIRDRALNQSNVTNSFDFVLNDITEGD